MRTSTKISYFSKKRGTFRVWVDHAEDNESIQTFFYAQKQNSVQSHHEKQILFVCK